MRSAEIAGFFPRRAALSVAGRLGPATPQSIPDARRFLVRRRTPRRHLTPSWLTKATNCSARRTSSSSSSPPTPHLTAKNITPGPLNTSVTNAKNDTVGKETTQEAKKTEAKQATDDYEISAGALYDLMTSVVDVCAGALGKKSAKGKQCLAIRKQLNKSKGGGSGGGGGTSGGG